MEVVLQGVRRLCDLQARQTKVAMQGVRRLPVDQRLQADDETRKMQAPGRQLYCGSLQGGGGHGIGGGDREGRLLGGGSVQGVVKAEA